MNKKDVEKVTGLLTEIRDLLVLMSTPEDLVLYTPEQFAKIIGKSSWWVNNETRAGRIPCIYFGKTRRYAPHHVREVLSQNEVKPHRYRRRA